MNRRVNLKYLSFVNSECIYLHTFSKFNKMFLFLSFFFTFLEEIHIETDSGILFHTQLILGKSDLAARGPFHCQLSHVTLVSSVKNWVVCHLRQLKPHTFFLVF